MVLLSTKSLLEQSCPLLKEYHIALNTLDRTRLIPGSFTVTGIKFTVKVCETMVDGEDARPCKKRKCKLDRKELVTERKKSEVLRTEILTRAATAKWKKEAKKTERRAQSNSTTLNITINPNLMVVIPSKITIVEPREPLTMSKTSMTPKTSKTSYWPSATPIPPSSSPKALNMSYLNIPSTSNMVKSVQSPKAMYPTLSWPVPPWVQQP
jgi:hypothetical protein